MAAIPSVKGTTAYYALEPSSAGVVYCHADGDHRGQVFRVRAGIGWYYQTKLDGARSRLGLPVSNEELTEKGAMSRFEAGAIEWDAEINWARAYLGADPARAILLHEQKL